MEKATFAGGCFWCQDAVFRMLKGVHLVRSGYSGGDTKDPSYETVSEGVTWHREAVQIEYDPDEISFEDLLEVFWTSHDPTQVGGQGSDIGPQYEAAIFYHTEEQRSAAEQSKQALEGSTVYDAPIATEILPYKNFYPAEEYHQGYYQNNSDAPYCQLVINPKVEKVRELFSKKLK
ncbi:MAG: peptide-methionine (S)-S-oxide reductase MsrA [Candidatus Paceibacterota bacterium]